MGINLAYSYGALPVVVAPSLTWRVKSAIIPEEKSHAFYYGKENHCDFNNRYFKTSL